MDALVIGAGPAGLMAAEQLAAPGRRVVVAEAMPTPARKFLMAGKSGLNLTKDEPFEAFAARVSGYLDEKETGFGPAEVLAWARGLGVELFTGSTGRVFPVGMKASPMLRAWLGRLAGAGIELRTGWRWSGFDDGFRFQAPHGVQVLRPKVAVLALGGASWPRLGSDAGWVPWIRDAGVEVAPFRPANMGFRVDWSQPMQQYYGAAVKGVAIRAGGQDSRGEWVISQGGIEGGGVYELSAIIRDGAPAVLDLAPDLGIETLAGRMSRPRGKLSVGNWLRRVLGDSVKVALLLEWGRPLPETPDELARLCKALPMRLQGPMPLDRAISSAGGIMAAALDADLQLHALPGVFAAGEMLDWEAPTGGYLLTTCLATGRRAGRAAARLLVT
ncbi:TIGR03862 family flavoprotein [Paracoccus sp. M683]|uniref:NAD(P)/FAD-dependent oxidoreductase n=1 Tax=Paracoccus sp. M683 TaxID=2594268 RepID=UPI00117C034D|nr:TIGR03862 family flavoprotein [Paracoccus sp. M683]TRW98872.1 TIGR03862 family flavoprotein [Paracoccus sp. M683]